MTSRVLCRYFMQGACKKGESCQFSHNWNDQPSMVCTFYQRGVCSFGDKCRYDHVRVQRPDTVESRGGPLENSSSYGSSPGAQGLGSHGHQAYTAFGNGMQSMNAGEQVARDSSNLAATVMNGGAASSSTNRGPKFGPLGLSSPGGSGDYNLPATLDSPYGANEQDWDFDEGLPEGAFDDEEVPDDEFEDFQKEAADFAAKGAALRQGLAVVTLQDPEGPGTSDFVAPGFQGPAMNPLMVHSPTTSPHQRPQPPWMYQGSSLGPQGGAFHSLLSGTAATFVPGQSHPAQGFNGGLGPAWGGASGSGPSAREAAPLVEEVIPGPRQEEAAASGNPEDQPICAYAAAGKCPKGNACEQMHGDVCPSCGKECLHPFRPQEREQHLKSCERNQHMLESLHKSQEIECSVCLERVLSKVKASERKFGVLSGCDHPFCISCIRSWRGGIHSQGLDLDTVVRACPVCRVQSHYVTPSVVWYFSPEEKEELVKGYKKRLNEIDCKHFDFGKGQCPFGTSCFYRHAYPDGRREEVKLRHLLTADGTTVIEPSIRLSDFIVRKADSRRS